MDWEDTPPPRPRGVPRIILRVTSQHKLMELSARYTAALKSHLGGVGEPANPLELGGRAASMGLDTLDLAEIHGAALRELLGGRGPARSRRKAGKFFALAHTPIEAARRGAWGLAAKLERANLALARQAAALASAKREISRGMARARQAEEALKKSAERHAKFLGDSARLQDDLRLLTRRLLAAQEDDRRKISPQLREEVGQTLLGIRARLLAIKTENRSKGGEIAREIEAGRRVLDIVWRGTRAAAGGTNPA